MRERRFWIGVVSKDHVDRATAGGFALIAAAMGRSFATDFPATP